MRAIFWILFIGLIFGGFLYFKNEVNMYRFNAFMSGKDIQVLPDGKILTLGKTEVFILNDDKIYMLNESCQKYLEFFRQYPQNMPRSVLQRCLIE